MGVLSNTTEKCVKKRPAACYQLFSVLFVNEPLRTLASMALRQSSVPRGSDAFLHSSTFSLRSLSCALYHSRVCASALHPVSKEVDSRARGNSSVFIISSLLNILWQQYLLKHPDSSLAAFFDVFHKHLFCLIWWCSGHHQGINECLLF